MLIPPNIPSAPRPRGTARRSLAAYPPDRSPPSLGRLTRTAAQRACERAVQRIREGLLLSRAVRAVTAGLDARAAQPVHEVPDRQALADALRRVLVATRID